jgi:hypothetical protein
VVTLTSSCEPEAPKKARAVPEGQINPNLGPKSPVTLFIGPSKGFGRPVKGLLKAFERPFWSPLKD